MSLAELGFPSVIDTSSTDIVSEFFIPALANSIRYDRGVGYFSSSWFRLTAPGMVQFAANGGLARWIVSPILSQADWAALNLGSEAQTNPILFAALARNIADLQQSLEQDTLSALAWMVADGVLSFKLALPVNRLAGGDFHDKFGRFEGSDGSQVCFMGSHNESLQGTINSESFSVYASWSHESIQPYMKSISSRFEMLWGDNDPNVRVYSLPEAARQQILELRDSERAYPAPDPTRFKQLHDDAAPYRIRRVSLPEYITLRGYQEEAIEAWFANGNVGLFEMATGTGKTITALAASVKLFQQQRRLAVIMAAPYQHLVDQWKDEAEGFGYRPILAYQSQERWRDKLQERVYAYNHGDLDAIAVITTHATFASEGFQNIIATLEGPVLLIADEVHHLGARNRRKFLAEQIPYRLALSATPDRWFDDVGTGALRGYFDQTVFELTLGEAIGLSLTPYYYHPVLVELTEEEMEDYRALSIMIARMFAKGVDEDDEKLGALLRKRSGLLNNAANKIEIISQLVDQQKPLDHALFYCAPGGQINDVMRLLGLEKRLLAHRFTAHEDTSTRRELLARFDNGDLQALVAMNCLDEGVDVPSTRTAFILASSGNPRQFIQRRGRVLRKYPGKEYAVVYDLIAVPPLPDYLDRESVGAERSILRRELKRFVEFADSAQNTQQAYDVIWDLADQFEILDFE